MSRITKSCAICCGSNNGIHTEDCFLRASFPAIYEHMDRVIECCYKLNEIGPLDDGYQYFWIKDRGAMSAADLRVIADELDRRNSEWDEIVEAAGK